MKNGYRGLKIEAILEQELFSGPPLMPVIVAKLTGPRQDITRVFKLTKDIASRAELKHLRRVRDTNDGEIECIVCSLDSKDHHKLAESDQHDMQMLQQTHKDKLRDIEGIFKSDDILRDFRIALVPSEAPRTEHQLKSCQQIWPCKYAKSNYLIKCIEGSVFDQAERLVVEIIANELLKHIETLSQTGRAHTSGAVIFRYAQVYGVGLSCCKTIRENPTKHSAMLAIDSVAKNAGSGHWKSTDKTITPETEPEQVLKNLIQNQLDARQSELADHKMETDFLPYLCTNYDVIITEEPCMMCAMGLVQSRIRRLFYLDSRSSRVSIEDNRIDADTNDKTDTTNNRCPRGVVSVCFPDQAIEKFLVHRDKSLNHRFEAWRLKLT